MVRTDEPSKVLQETRVWFTIVWGRPTVRDSVNGTLRISKPSETLCSPSLSLVFDGHRRATPEV